MEFDPIFETIFSASCCPLLSHAEVARGGLRSRSKAGHCEHQDLPGVKPHSWSAATQAGQTNSRVCNSDRCETTPKFLLCGNLFMLFWCGDVGPVQGSGKGEHTAAKGPVGSWIFMQRTYITIAVVSNVFTVAYK